MTEHLQGLIAAPFTPMDATGALNLDIIPAYYEMLKANGVKGAFIGGSTGEGVSLTLDEKKQLTDSWAAVAKNDADFKLMLFLGGTSIAECKALAQYAERAGIYAVSFTAPYYFKPASVQQLAKACIDIAATVPGMPFYYYHIPVLTGVGFAMYDLLQAVDGKAPNFAGVKYTHEDFMDFLSCLRYKNDWELAQSLQQQSIDMIRLLGKYGGIATGKAYMKIIGLDCGEFRLPVANMNADAFSRFSQEVEALGFSSFCSRLPVPTHS